MTVTYSKKASGNKKLSDNFTVSEFACKDGSDKIIIDTALVELLQKIRNHFKSPVTITSGYRNAAYNKKVGGAPGSQHCLGTAADIVISGVTPLEIAQYAEHLLGTSGGIGLYKNFTHVDVRKNRARWDNTSGREISVSGFSGYTDKENIMDIETAKKILKEKAGLDDSTISYLMFYKYGKDLVIKLAKAMGE